MTRARGIRWKKSSYSGGESGQCVELGDDGSEDLLVRDSKNPEGGYLTVTRRQVRHLAKIAIER